MKMNILGKTGLVVSELGFGAAPLGDEYGKLDTAEARRAVLTALDLGINFFDTAPYYGRTLSEERLGQALEGRRHQTVLATKVARYGVADFDFSAARVMKSAEESLQRLRTEYVDILHVHDVEFGDKRQIVDETLPTLRKLKEQGKARFIGVTGLSLRMLQEIAEESPLDCVLSYCRYNLLNRDLLQSLQPFVLAKGMGMISASPLHLQLLTGNGIPSWHPAPPVIREAAEKVVEACRSHGASPSAVALQFAIDNPNIHSTFVGFSTVREVQENCDAIQHRADPSLLAEIEEIVAPVKHLMWITGKSENH